MQTQYPPTPPSEDEMLDTLVKKLSASALGVPVTFRVERDCKDPVNGRFFIQCQYQSPCSVKGDIRTWGGRKWYLSEHMTEDEVVKTAYAAFKACVEHEIMEGFHFEGQRVFNPHTPFRTLIESSQHNAYRPHN